MGTHTTTTRTIITNQPQATSHMTIMRQERDWSTGLCACFEDMSSCLCAFICPCFMECILATDANEFCGLPLFVPGATIALRTKLRVESGIKGSICDDCVKVAFCPGCAMAQMKRERTNIQTGQV